MKVLPFKIPKPHQVALVFQTDEGSIFYDKLHQHEEIQLSYIVEGEDTRKPVFSTQKNIQT